MGLLFSILTLPYAPVRAVTAVTKVLKWQAESELHGSASLRRQLEGLDEAAAAGEISEADRSQAEEVIVDRLLGQPPQGR